MYCWSGLENFEHHFTSVCCCQVETVVSDSVRPHRWQPTRLPRSGILQARILEWVAISFSRGSSQPRDRTWVSCIAGRRTPSHQGFQECSNYRTTALISHASKVMLKILQARLQQYVSYELPDVQAGFREGRGTRCQNA